MWRRREPPLDDETVSGLIRILMRIEAKLDEALAMLREEEDDGEEADA